MSTNKHSTFFDCKLVSGGPKNSFVSMLVHPELVEKSTLKDHGKRLLEVAPVDKHDYII